MSAMSASSGLMPLSLISEHKAAQGGPPPVQPLSRTPEKHSLVQAPKPTPNGMEPSPPLIPLLPPSQPEPQPSLPCGGKSEIVSEEDRSGGSVPDIQVPAAGPAPPSIGAVPEQSLAAETAELPVASELPIAVNQAPSSLTPSPHAPSPVTNTTVQQPQSNEGQAEPVQESLPRPEAIPTPEPAQVPLSELNSKAPEEPTQESQETQSQETAVTSSPAVVTPSVASPPVVATPAPTQAPATRQPKRTKQNASIDKKPPSASEEDEFGDDRKSKRKRLPTQIYQSPIPELNLIAKISKIDKTPASADDKLIVFYRNEFLAVRNAEGGFYICQAMQNVYKTSSRIRIRWLSQVANTDHYSPDFYDYTEFDCILTNLNLERIDKNKFRLPDIESQRTQSILKRAIDVEKGIAPPEETSITEEHPDGLDLSLYRNEDQLKKRKSKSKGTKKKEKKGSSENVPKRTTSRSSSRKVRSDSDTKKPSAVTVQSRRLGRPVKVEKPVVQRIVAAKKMGRRKLAGAVSAAVKQVKKETKPPVAIKRKNESQPAPVPEKKLKSGASKTRSGVAGGPSGPQQRARRSSTRTK